MDWLTQMIKVLFEDNHIIVAVKPYGMLSQADITGDADILTELKKYIKKKHNKPGNVFLGLVHRLDKNVSGVMVFAKTSKAAARLSKQIQSHKFKKTYLAVVNGELTNEATLKHYLLKSDELRKSIAYDKEVVGSKYAELSYNIIESKQELTLIKVNLKTGRAHQIRVQLSKIGHPIVKDSLYISGFKDSNSPIALFAFELQFAHPVTQEILSFSAKPPIEAPWSMFNL
jgi:23S rRNA pseudouridine1911/1915/1917 synthase